MKRIVLFTLLYLMAIVQVVCGEYVGGYTRKDGTYVSWYYRSDSPDIA